MTWDRAFLKSNAVRKIIKLLSKSVKPGNLFYIPAMKNNIAGFVISRYIDLVQPNVGYLIEVFAKFYTDPPKAIDEVDATQRLFRPVMFSMYFGEIPKWKILFSDPEYSKSQSDYANITFAFHDDLWIGGQGGIRPDSPEQLRDFEESICWRTHHLIFRVNAHLAGLLGPNERYDYHRVPAKYRIDDPAGIQEVRALAAKIDERSKSWKFKET